MVNPINEVANSVYANRITRVDEYDLAAISRRNLFKTFYPIDFCRYLVFGLPCGLTAFHVPDNASESKIYNVQYWDGKNALVRKGHDTLTHETETVRHFHDNKYLYAGLHKNKLGKIEITGFMNVYANSLFVTVNELVRLLFMMNVIDICDYHSILEHGECAVTTITCGDDLIITTKQNSDYLEST